MQQLHYLFPTCCSTCVIPSSWIPVLTSRLLLHQSSVLISSSRPHVVLLELAPCLLSRATVCSLSTSAPPQPPPLPCSNDAAPPLLLSSPLLPLHSLIHLPRACPQDSFTAVSLPALMTSTSPMPLASFAPSDYWLCLLYYIFGMRNDSDTHRQIQEQTRYEHAVTQPVTFLRHFLPSFHPASLRPNLVPSVSHWPHQEQDPDLVAAA